MKCQNLFSGKNKKYIINLSSARLAQIMVKVNIQRLHHPGYLHSLIKAFPVWICILYEIP